jgi:hypothetical protein
MAKVTIGFKCDPYIKHELLTEAVESGISLSEYVENICANRWAASAPHLQLDDEKEELQKLLEESRSRLAEYEVAMLGPLFKRHQGETMDMRMPDGSVVQKQVNHPIDVLEIILSSVKSKP